MLSFTILGEPASKANSRRLVLFGKKGQPKRPGFIKSQKALDYVNSFRRQCPQPRAMLTGDLVVSARIFYATRRPDLDASLIFDAMQGFLFENDRQIKEQHLYWGLDPQRPRAEISIQPVAPSLL